MAEKMMALLARISLGAGVDEKTIAEVETQLGFSFPGDYVTFLKSANGAAGPIGTEGYISLWPINELVSLNEGYEVAQRAPALVLFGSDGGGEAFAFERTNDSKYIIQVTFIGMGTDPKWIISHSFSDFIENYDKRIFTPIE